MGTEYKWKGSVEHLHKVDAQTAGEECSRLTKEGKLTPKTLVNASRPEDAPLHPEFEWDDPVAAELYREVQARHVIRDIVVVREEVSNIPVRNFIHIKVENEHEYKELEVVLNNKSDRQYMIEEAYREMRAYIRKYHTLSELQPLFAYARELFESLDELEDVEDEEN